MLPTNLKSTYLSYKEDTNTFIHWIVKTSKKHGADQPAGRLKGKARKQAKQPKAAAESAYDQDAAGKEVAITVADLLRYATVIAQGKTKEILPKDILHQAIRAIRGRRHCTGWFENNAPGDLANATHSHFSDMLEQVLRLLVTDHDKSKTTDKGKGKAKAPEPDEPAFTNLFENLTIDEILESDEPLPHIEEMAKTPAPVKYIVEDMKAQMLEEETAFAALCLFADYQQLRKVVQQSWKEYAKGSVDIISVATGTHVAMLALESLEAEFVQSFPSKPKFGDWFTLVSDTFIHPDPNKMFRALETMAMLRDVGTSIGIVMKIHAATGLRYNVGTSRNNWQGFKQEPIRDTFQTMKNRRQSDEDAKNSQIGSALKLLSFTEDMSVIALHEHRNLPELNADVFTRLFVATIAGVVKDRLTLGRLRDETYRDVGISLVGTTLMFVDVHDILGADAERAFNDIKHTGEYIKDCLQNYLAHLRDQKNNISSRQKALIPRADKLIDRIDKWIFSDPILTHKRAYYTSIKKIEFFEKELEVEGPSYFLRHQPILCGKIMAEMLVLFHDIQTDISKSNITVFTGHLFSIVRTKLDEQEQEWIDMDVFCDFHQQNAVFLDKTPRDASAAIRRIDLASGMSITAVAKDPSRRRPKFNPKNIRLVTTTGALEEIYADQRRDIVGRELFLWEDLMTKRMHELFKTGELPKSELWARMTRDGRLTHAALVYLVTYTVLGCVSDYLHDQGHLEIDCARILHSIEKHLAESSPLLKSSIWSVDTGSYELLHYAPWNLLSGCQTEAQIREEFGLRDAPRILDLVADNISAYAAERGHEGELERTLMLDFLIPASTDDPEELENMLRSIRAARAVYDEKLEKRKREKMKGVEYTKEMYVADIKGKGMYSKPDETSDERHACAVMAADHPASASRSEDKT